MTSHGSGSTLSSFAHLKSGHVTLGSCSDPTPDFPDCTAWISVCPSGSGRTGIILEYKFRASGTCFIHQQTPGTESGTWYIVGALKYE